MEICNPACTADDILALYTFTEAIPKYIELFVDAGVLTKDKMINFIARPESPFIEEGRKLLVNEFGKKYETYSGEVLERFFKAELMESMRYRAIDSWWDPKGYIDERGNHQQAEIDIIAIDVTDKQAKIFEVKRNPDKYRRGLLEKKVEFMTSKEKKLKKYNVELGCLSLDDICKRP